MSKSLNSLINKDGGDIKVKLSRKAQPKKVEKKKDSTESDTIESTEINVKLNELIYPCKDEILYTKVALYPYQMNNDLYINLKKNLIEKLENKCSKDGYIVKIYKILEYENGIIDPENFTGVAVFNVKYLAKICLALKETTIIAKITQYIPNANFVLAEFGNIIKIIFTKSKRDYNIKMFSVGNDKNIMYLPNQTILKVNDFVKIQLKTIKFFQGDNCIKCMGYLEDVATIEEINEFSFNDVSTIKEVKSEKTTVFFNEYNEVEENNIDKSELNNTMNI